jgi:hypothetical protein
LFISIDYNKKKVMWSSFFSGGKDPLKELGYEILPDSQQTTSNPRSIWTLLNGKKKVK